MKLKGEILGSPPRPLESSTIPPSALVQWIPLVPKRPQCKTQARVQYGSTSEQACSDEELIEHL